MLRAPCGPARAVLAADSRCWRPARTRTRIARRLLQPRCRCLRARRADVRSARRASRRRSRASRPASTTRRSAPSATIRRPTSGTAAPSIRSCRPPPKDCFAAYRSPRLAELAPWARRATERSRLQGRRDLPDRHRLRHQPRVLAKSKRRRRRAAGRISSDPSIARRSSSRIRSRAAPATRSSPRSSRCTARTARSTICKRLHPNVVRYTQSGTAQGPSVARGEVGVGVIFVHEFVTQQLAGFAVDIAIPCEGTGDALGGMAIINGAPHPDEARAFYDWALTQAGAGARQPHANLIIPANAAAAIRARGRALRGCERRSTSTRRIRQARRAQAAARALAARDRRRAQVRYAP